MSGSLKSPKYYGVAAPKEVDGKTHWVQLGKAFPQKDGKIKIKIDALPLNFDGELLLFPHYDNKKWGKKD